MSDDLLIQKIKEGTRIRSAMPAKEWLADMVRRGVLDEKGNVLIRMPQPPWEQEESPEPAAPPATPAALNGEAKPKEPN